MVGGGAEEVSATFPTLILIAQQTQVSLTHQRCGLQSLARRLELHFMRRQFSELFIHEGEQIVGRLGVAALQRLQDACDFGHAETNSKKPGPVEVGKR